MTMFRVTVRWVDGGEATIASCHQHVSRTMLELGTPVALIEIKDQTDTCKGCLEGWEREDGS